MAAVAAAITAAVAVGTTAYTASQSGKAAGGGGAGKPSKVPLPPYASALNKQVARAMALNMGQVAPSFADYVKSGGTATFPFIDPGMTPREREQLGLVGPSNLPVPFEPRATSTRPLTLEQLIFEGTRRLGKDPTRQDPISRLVRATNQLKRLQDQAQTPRREKREGKVGEKIGSLKTKLGVG